MIIIFNPFVENLTIKTICFIADRNNRFAIGQKISLRIGAELGMPESQYSLGKTLLQKTYYLEGGMAAHLNLQKGKYNITVYTPKDQAGYFTSQNPCSNDGDWSSNTFYYDTENPTKVIFVVPTADDNGFYNGGWYIDYKAPKYYRMTIPKQ